MPAFVILTNQNQDGIWAETMGAIWWGWRGSQ